MTYFLFLCLCVLRTTAEVMDAPEESTFTLPHEVDLIAFSNFTTNNPLDNLKDFPDTWQPDYDVHEFSLEAAEQGKVPDQLAVESGSREGVTALAPQVIVS